MERGSLRVLLGEEARSETFARLSESETWNNVRGLGGGGGNETHLSPSGTRLPAPDQTPSTQAPLRPITARTKRASSSSYSILACSRDTLLSGPRSTSTVL